MRRMRPSQLLLSAPKCEQRLYLQYPFSIHDDRERERAVADRNPPHLMGNPPHLMEQEPSPSYGEPSPSYGTGTLPILWGTLPILWNRNPPHLMEQEPSPSYGTGSSSKIDKLPCDSCDPIRFPSTSSILRPRCYVRLQVRCQVSFRRLNATMRIRMLTSHAV
jgi:hypothetical protein